MNTEGIKQHTVFYQELIFCLTNFTSPVLPIYATSFCQTEKKIKLKHPIFMNALSVKEVESTESQ